jgi:hypothetical protein
VILVHGSAQEIGRQVLSAPGPGGALFVSVPAAGGTVVAQFDATGQLRPGWPISINGMRCELLLPVDDGSVRLVCQLSDDETAQGPSQGLAFDAAGSQLTGWPVDLPCCFIGRVLDDTLVVYGREFHENSVDGWIVAVAADGTVHNGERVTYPNCCEDIWAVGPEGEAYGSVLHSAASPDASTSELAAVGPAGVPGGFPIAIDGIASGPAFDKAGRIHVTVAIPFEAPSRTLTFSQRGRSVEAGTGEFDVAVSGEFAGIEGSSLQAAAPLVGTDGTTFVIDAFGDGTTVAGANPLGEAMPGWPYRSGATAQATGVCPAGDVCEGSFWALPAIGPDNTLNLIHAAADSSTGGNIVAIGQDGKVRPGWPVTLQRPGSGFWSVVVGSDGTAYALAIEPGAEDASSASILAIAPDGTVLYTTTIIEP